MSKLHCYKNLAFRRFMGTEEEASWKVRLECQSLLCSLSTHQRLESFVLGLSLMSQYCRKQNNGRCKEVVISHYKPRWAAGVPDLFVAILTNEWKHELNNAIEMWTVSATSLLSLAYVLLLSNVHSFNEMNREPTVSATPGISGRLSASPQVSFPCANFKDSHAFFFLWFPLAEVTNVYCSK